MSKELEFAIEAVRQAGQITLEFFQNPKLAVSKKEDGSPVTQADKTAEEFLREKIQSTFPKDDIIGEEFGVSTGQQAEPSKPEGAVETEKAEGAKRSWVIDPIDGTVSFVNGVPTYSTLLALGNPEAGRWDLGVIYIPALQEMVYAEKGRGCWRISYADSNNAQPKQIKVSTRKKLADSVVVSTGADYIPPEVIRSAKTFRTWGDGYGYLLLASGQAEVMLDADVSIWDIAPIYTIIPEAGGEVFHWEAKNQRKGVQKKNAQEGDKQKKSEQRVAAKMTGASNAKISKDLSRCLDLEQLDF